MHNVVWGCVEIVTLSDKECSLLIKLHSLVKCSHLQTHGMQDKLLSSNKAGYFRFRFSIWTAESIAYKRYIKFDGQFIWNFPPKWLDISIT